MSDDSKRVVIIGGGFGGLEAAKGLGDSSARVTVVDSSNFHLFQPLLYQVATAGLSPADIASPIRHILRRYSNIDVHMKRVTGVDVANREVIAQDERIPYDYLVIATGARHSYLGHDDWAKFAPGLKSISDATRLRRKILLAFERADLEPDEEKRKAMLTFVIVGGGPTGVELAGAISELAQKALAREFRHVDPRIARIFVIEAGQRILAGFSPSLSSNATLALTKLKVDVITGSRVTRIDEDGVLIGERRIEAKTVIWAAGVVASPAGQWLNAEVDKAGRVIVNSDLSVKNHKNIFVIGDTAHVEQDGQLLPGVSPVAMQEGRFVARLIRGRLKGEDGEQAPFRYFNKGNLATIGRRAAVADFGKFKLHGFIAWIAWLLVHIYYLIGFRNRVVVLLEWGWAYLTFQKGARLIVSGDETNQALD